MTKDEEVARLQREYAGIHRRMTTLPRPKVEEELKLQRREEEIRQRVEALGGKL